MNNKVINYSIIAGVGFATLVASLFLTTSGGGLLKASSANASDCEHKGTVNHHERVEPTLLKAGAKEYWCCCDCHKSFEDSACTQLIDNTITDPTDPTDGRYLAPIGERLLVTPIRDGVVSSYLAPSDGLFDTVYECTPAKGALNAILDDFDISNYSRLSFGFCSADVWFVDFKKVWDLEPLKWYEYELVKNSSNKWDVYLSKNGSDLILRGENREGNALRPIMGFESNPETKYYVTNLRAIFAEEIIGTVVDSSLINANGKSAIPSTQINAPKGYNYVSEIDTLQTDDSPIFHGMHYSAVPIRYCSEVHFAIKTTGYFLFNNNWEVVGGPNQWFFFSMVQNNDYTWNLVVTLTDGTVKYSENNLNSFKGDEPGVYTNYALNSILFGCPANGFKASKQTGTDLVIAVTEVRGTKIVEGTLIDYSALSANGVSLTKVDEYIDGAFESVYKATDTFGTTAFDKYFSAINLSAYSEVYFMCNAHGWFLFDTWRKYIDANEWVNVTLVNKGNGLFDVTYTTSKTPITGADGKTYTCENVDSKSVPANCSAYALNTIITKANTFFQSGKEIHVTELRGVLAE